MLYYSLVLAWKNLIMKKMIFFGTIIDDYLNSIFVFIILVVELILDICVKFLIKLHLLSSL